jgi:hypothetical protein
MPRGPKGEKRPADVIGNAVHVMRIATGEIEETAPTKKESRAKKGGAKGVQQERRHLAPNSVRKSHVQRQGPAGKRHARQPLRRGPSRSSFPQYLPQN